MVRGGGVCHFHGGRSPRAVHARDVRIALAESRALFADRFEAREWTEALPAAAQVLDQVMRWLQEQVERAEYPSATDLDALMMAAEKTARLAKLVQDSNLDERRVKISENQGRVISAMILRFLARIGRDDEEAKAILREELDRLRSEEHRVIEA